jgi:hypothetical protein
LTSRRALALAILTLAGCHSAEVPHLTGGTSSGAGGGTSASSAGTGGATNAGSTGSMTSGSGGSVTPPGGVFVAVGYGGRRVRSTDDGHTWVDDAVLEANGGDDDKLLRTVVPGAGGFVALGWRAMTSPDGKTWVDHGANIGQWLGAAVYGKGQFVAVGGYGLRAVSADGVTWKDHSIDTIASHAADGLVFGDVMGGRYVAVNDSGMRSFSGDGVTWTYAAGATGTMTSHLAFGNGVFLGIGGAAVVTSSDGGATWTDATSLPAAAEGLVFGVSGFTAVGNGHVYSSPDGAIWQDQIVTDLQAGALAYGHGTYVMVTGTARRRSFDTVHWEAPFDDGGNALSWVTFGPAL